MPGASDTLTAFLSLAQGYAAARILTTAAKLGLFTPPFSPVSPESFAKARGISLRGLTRLLDALVALEVFEKTGDTYLLREGVRDLVTRFPGIPDDLIHHDHLYEVWERLEQGIWTGTSVPPTEEETRAYPASLETFLRAMRAHAGYLTDELMAAVPWDGIRAILDIGGGGGGFALALTRRFPSLTVTIADLPDAIRLTEAMLASCPERERIACVPCHAYAAPLPKGPYDRILISHLLHIYPPEENRQLLEKAARLLRPGGDILLLDYFLDGEETGPREAVLFRLLMTIGTPEGDCYSRETASEWLRHAGLTSINGHALSRGNSLLSARKPSGSRP